MKEMEVGKQELQRGFPPEEGQNWARVSASGRRKLRKSDKVYTVLNSVEHEKSLFLVRREFKESVKWHFKTKGNALPNKIVALVTMGC